MPMNIVVPIWGIVLGIVSYLTPIAWAIITMFFAQKETKRILESIEIQIENQEKLIQLIDTKFETKHSHLENAVNDKFDRFKDSVQLKLTEINNTVISTKTLVDLLVGDKIKKS